MIQIPILPRDEFFEIAIGVAKVAKNNDDFKKIFEERNKERLAELEAFLSEGESRSERDMKHFPCHDAFVRTVLACCDPNFSNLMRVLKGNAFGWEADEELYEDIIDEAPVDPNGDYQDPNMETQPIDYWEEEYEGDMEPRKYIPDEDFILPKGTTNKSSNSAKGKRKRVQFDDDITGPDEQQQQELEDANSNPALQDSPSASQAANESAAKPNGVNERRHKCRRLERSPAQASSPQSSTKARKSDKRSRRDEDEDVSRKRQRLESPTMQAPTSHASSPGQSTRSQVSKKRSRRDDDGDHSHKRQKLETSTTQTPTSDAPLSPQWAVEQPKLSKKRSRHDGNNDSSHKRQKRENSAASDMASPHIAGQPTANGTAAVGSGPQKKGHQRASQKRKTAAANTSHARSPPSRSPNTRSLRRNGSATLWELDGSGKAKLR
ncbi:uncharacterized protein TrAtP1_005491 [Trichoderma atroviride]|nr:hypothetical protein TrAtP1_005491 [Trichoderma atroviride]